MPRLRATTAILMLMFALPVGATPELAKKIQETWELKAAEWKAAMLKAENQEQHDKAMEIRPKQAAYAARMWGAIENSLDEPWTIEHNAWFLQMSNGILKTEGEFATPRNNIDNILSSPTPTPNGAPVLMFAKEIAKAKSALLTHHATKPDPRLNKLCLALTRLADPMSLSILEKIESANPDPKIQGVAALSAAMAIKTLGDDVELMRKRLTYIRKAIINSAEVEIGGTTVAVLAENELYQIRFLSKGRVAPEITGMDSTGKAFQLSKQKGRITILIFWSSTIPQAEHTIQYTNEMAAKFKDMPVDIIGINHDPLAKLRAMRVDGTVKWRNLSDPTNQLAKDYRVGSWPKVYVLDHKQQIHHVGVLGSFAELTAVALISEIK